MSREGLQHFLMPLVAVELAVHHLSSIYGAEPGLSAIMEVEFISIPV